MAARLAGRLPFPLPAVVALALAVLAGAPAVLLGAAGAVAGAVLLAGCVWLAVAGAAMAAGPTPGALGAVVDVVAIALFSLQLMTALRRPHVLGREAVTCPPAG